MVAPTFSWSSSTALTGALEARRRSENSWVEAVGRQRHTGVINGEHGKHQALEAVRRQRGGQGEAHEASRGGSMAC